MTLILVLNYNANSNGVILLLECEELNSSRFVSTNRVEKFLKKYYNDKGSVAASNAINSIISNQENKRAASKLLLSCASKLERGLGK